MAARPTWKGYLKISLVNIPVKVFPATDASATISFNQLHAECQTRIQQKRWCPTCQKDVPNTDIVKGYEFEKGRWVVVDDEDIAKVKTESTKIINLLQFTDIEQIDPMYVDKTYYLAPEGPMAADAYSVMREGMPNSKPGSISTVRPLIWPTLPPLTSIITAVCWWFSIAAVRASRNSASASTRKERTRADSRLARPIDITAEADSTRITSTRRIGR